MLDDSTPITELRRRVAVFAAERDWHRVHSPKTLARALAVEAAELMEIFEWKTEEQSWAIRQNPNAMRHVAQELAHIAVCILNLCNRLDIDLTSAVMAKLSQNVEKYPIEPVRGSSEESAKPR